MASSSNTHNQILATTLHTVPLFMHLKDQRTSVVSHGIPGHKMRTLCFVHHHSYNRFCESCTCASPPATVSSVQAVMICHVQPHRRMPPLPSHKLATGVSGMSSCAQSPECPCACAAQTERWLRMVQACCRTSPSSAGVLVGGVSMPAPRLCPLAHTPLALETTQRCCHTAYCCCWCCCCFRCHCCCCYLCCYIGWAAAAHALTGMQAVAVQGKHTTALLPCHTAQQSLSCCSQLQAAAHQRGQAGKPEGRWSRHAQSTAWLQSWTPGVWRPLPANAPSCFTEHPRHSGSRAVLMLVLQSMHSCAQVSAAQGSRAIQIQQSSRVPCM